jgi:hypothetical protein
MKRVLIGLVLAFSVLACHPPASVVTPQGKSAYTADQVVVRVGELEKAAIQANATVVDGKPSLDEASTRLIVQTCVSIAQTLKTVPDGWQAVVKQSWASFKVQAPPTLFTHPTIGVLLTTVDALIKGL